MNRIILVVIGLLIPCFLIQAVETEGDEMKKEKIILAGGCFWCTESAFHDVSGVLSAVSGYTAGKIENPTYEEVSSGQTGHYEAVEVTFDPQEISLEEVLNVFWREIDPTDSGGQFADRGSQYQTAIFYFNDEQKRIAAESKVKLEKSEMFAKPIATKILKANAFYTAEEYHQNYSKKQPEHYQAYRQGSGREAFLEKKWNNAPNLCPLPKKGSSYNKPGNAALKKKLTPLQYSVTQEDSTEPAFRNEYWNNHKEGIYVDIVSGEPLFSSLDKYDSQTGWPSFSKPLDEGNLVEKKDSTYGMTRVEVRSKKANSHLGHVFNDGSSPTGMRYCMNSASLRFIPKEDLVKEGYSQYKKLFEK